MTNTADSGLATVRCYRCGEADVVRVRMTADERRFGMDVWQCRTCGCYQNRRGENEHHV